MGKYKVVLDPGHGQFGNPYPAASGFYEGTQMFKLATVLKAKLEASGIDVILTRNKISDDPALAVRGKTAGTNKADLFISLHSDAIGSYVSNSANGVSVFYSIKNPDSNKKFADNLCQSVANLMNTRARGAQTRIGSNNLDYYGVIRNSAASGCTSAFLIEHGFHTNPTDVKWLINDESLTKIADVECTVICNWFGVEAKGSSVPSGEISVVPNPDNKPVEKYEVLTTIPKYISAHNAILGDKGLSCGNMDPGEYYVYKEYGGAYNLTKTAGTAGAWINPNDNVKKDEPNVDPNYERYEVYKEIKKYATASDAKTMTNNKGTVEAGTYYIYKEYDGMINLSSAKGVAGFWMNPAQNIFESYRNIQVGDTVIFTPGFTPKYGEDGKEIPLSAIVKVCSNNGAKVIDRHVYNNQEYEVKLDLIMAWVPVKYLTIKLKAEPSDTTVDIIEDTSNNTTDESTEKKSELLKLIESLKDPKYEGIIAAIKSGVLSDFFKINLQVIEELFDDDTVEDSTVAYEMIMGPCVATFNQMVSFVKKRNPDFDPEIARAFLYECKRYNVRGDVALCQSIIETGWFKFTGGTAVKPEQHNYCGMGVTSLGMTGNSFSSIEVGVQAQIQHLYAYATKDDLPAGTFLYDPRFNYVTRGSAPRWIDLDGKWCAGGSNYGEKILQLWSEMLLEEK